MNELQKQEQKENQKDLIKKNILAQLKQNKLREEGSNIEGDDEDEDSDLSEDCELVIQH